MNDLSYGSKKIFRGSKHVLALIERFRLQTWAEGNDSLTYKKYNPDNPDIETWMCFKDDKLISISTSQKDHTIQMTQMRLFVFVVIIF